MQLQYGILNRKMDQIQDVLGNIEDRDNNIYRLYFESNPIPEEQRRAGFGGINRYRNLEGYDNSKIIVETSQRMDILTKQLVVQSKSLDEITQLAKEKEQLLASIPAIQPVKNENLKGSLPVLDGGQIPLPKLKNSIMEWIFLLPAAPLSMPPETAGSSGQITALPVMEIIYE
jgi:hypothetical protein